MCLSKAKLVQYKCNIYVIRQSVLKGGKYMVFNVTVIYLNGVKEYLRSIVKVTSEHGFWVLETSSGHVRKYDSRVKLVVNMYGY